MPAAGRYCVWVRVMGFGLWNNSFFVSPDGSTPAHYEAVPANKQWIWDTIGELDPFTQLAAGSHTLMLRGREANTRLDKIVIANRPDYIPGDDDVETCQTPVSKTAPPYIIALKTWLPLVWR